MSISDQRSDAELVRQCNTGQREDAIRAFDALYSRHKDYVLRVAFRYLHDADLVLDVLQETFTYLLRKFPPTGDGLELTAQLQTLLYTVAKNNAISLLRKNGKLQESADFDPDTLVAPPQAYSELGRLLHGLSARQREVVTLRFVDDMPLDDIGIILSVPTGTVKSRLNGAIRALRNSPYIKDFFEK